MSGGKYVRAPGYQSDLEEIDEHIDDMLAYESDSEGQEGKQLDTDGYENDEDSSCSEDASDGEKSISEVGGEEEHNAAESSSSVKGNASTGRPSMRNENEDYYRRMVQLEDRLNQLVRAIDSNQPLGGTNTVEPVPCEADHSWNTGNVNVGASTSATNVRWENIQPFPNDVPANRMWEQWTRFIDRFEIAASLSNINDPVKRAQILFLSMGEKLQGIARAARLRPSLEEPNCYNIFVKNIATYLRSMVDVTAEHEAFTNLKQGPEEPTIAFHARLMEKVRLCGYSSVDQDRFVRAQLLKGMRNKELVKAARTFGYETLFIVQSATREEAYTAETAQAEPSHALAVSRNHPRTSGETQQWKRKHESTADKWKHAKKRETDEIRNRGLGRRSRCPKCNRLFHKFGSCPAINSNCNTCGERGHFAIVCRRKNANHLQVERKLPSRWESDDEDRKVNLREN